MIRNPIPDIIRNHVVGHPLRLAQDYTGQE
jgi:hypothetical protein